MSEPVSAGSASNTQPTEEQRAEAARVGMGLALFARLVPGAPAVLSPSGDRSFRELNANANRLVRALRSRGLKSGDAVAVVCSNRPEFAEAVYACLRAGLRYTPVNWHLTPDEVAYIVSDCEARALIADGRFAEQMSEVAARTPAVTVRLAVGGAIRGFEDYTGALAEQGDAGGDDISDPELGTRMLYTSGTTGKPKGVQRPPAFVTTRTASTSAAKYILIW